MSRYTVTTQCMGDGSGACYAVYFNRQIVATFPINDPAESDAREYADRFAKMMDEHVDRFTEDLRKKVQQRESAR